MTKLILGAKMPKGFTVGEGQRHRLEELGRRERKQARAEERQPTPPPQPWSTVQPDAGETIYAINLPPGLVTPAALRQCTLVQANQFASEVIPTNATRVPSFFTPVAEQILAAQSLATGVRPETAHLSFDFFQAHTVRF